MAVAFRGRNSDFDRQKQCDKSDYFSLDETHDTDQQSYDRNTAARYPQLYTEPTEPTSKISHGIRSTNDFEKLEANSAKNVTIPRYILLILVVVAIVTSMVCVTLLMIILLTMMPQNISDAAKEVVSFAAVIRVVTLRSSPTNGCSTAAKETTKFKKVTYLFTGQMT